MTIKEAQELIETWTGKTNQHTNELTRIAILTEEIGRLNRVIVHRYNDHATEPHFRYEVSDEIGDILWTLIGLSNQTGVDLTASLIHALERKSKTSDSE
ncbi:MAG: MazG nucleotide pyrophosphohydrolase domain-containing protein [Alistipes sp.]|nr:MazG nucleotide pyrophosphohydrolase domain-containing protein [Alistipes sp.]